MRVVLSIGALFAAIRLVRAGPGQGRSGLRFDLAPISH
jgi:hypothetical protein